MINSRRISLVERYLSGRMGPSEAQEFRRRLEVDPKLRQILRDEQEIEDAFRRDRESIPMPGSHRFEQFLKASGQGIRPNEIFPLAASSALHAASAQLEQETTRERFAYYISNNRILIIAAFAAAILALIFFLPNDDASEQSVTPAASGSSVSGPSGGIKDTPRFGDHINMRSPVRDLILRTAVETALRWKAGVKSLSGFRLAVPVGDSMLLGTHSLPRTITDSVPASLMQHRKPSAEPPARAMTFQDSVDAMLRFMEKENRTKEPTIEISDSVRVHFDLRD